MPDSAKQINKLFLLANIQENIILDMKNHQFKQLAKHKFNKMIKEIKNVNKFINGHLDSEEIEGIDDLADEIDKLVSKYV